MKKLITLILMSLISVGAVAGDWKKLGERRVSFGLETDVDTIPVSAFKGRYDKVALRVDDAPIFMKNIKVFFGDGKTQTISINKRLERGKRTMAFRLLDAPRVINKVELSYRKALGTSKSAEVKLYGLKD